MRPTNIYHDFPDRYSFDRRCFRNKTILSLIIVPILTVLFLLGFFLIPNNDAFAKVIWCNPVNIGIENGIEKKLGYKTLHKAVSMMVSGDTVIIADGDWRKTSGMHIDTKHSPPDGTELNYSRILAETDWNVKLPYIHIETTKDNPTGYLEFRGIVFDNRYIGSGITHISYNMHHTKFVRCGFLAHGLKGNTHTCGFGSEDSTKATNQYNLMEECIAWGSGRYVFYCKYGKFNIFRRCVARHDFNAAPQMFNFRAYACAYTVYQNCISIDSDRVVNFVNPINGESGGYWISDQGDQYGEIGNIINGCISIKDIQLAYYISGNKNLSGLTTVRNCIALDMTYKLPKLNTLCALMLLQDENAIVLNFTGVGAELQGHDGIYCKKSGKKYIENCIIRDVNDEGVGINPSSDSVTINNVVHYNTGGGKYGKGSKRIDPFKNGLMYPVRIEANSELATLGRNGTVCGATILRKIGVSGSLYGEPGWNTVIDERLWPFPNETKIRELMRETVEGVSGIYGFCEDGQTLTNYIWGYFGNAVPPFSLKAVPGDGKAGIAWGPPANIVLPTVVGYNVYDVTQGHKKLIGATVHGNRTYEKTLSGLVNGRTYRFAVTTIDKIKGESGLSYTVSVTPGKGSAKTLTSESQVSLVKPAEIIISKKDISAVPEPEKNTVEKKKFTNKIGMGFVLISPGVFEMGILSTQNETKSGLPHKVNLTEEFYMQTTEVTQGQWKEIMGTNPSFFKNCGDDCPVEQVSWNDVELFIKRLNDFEETNSYRLPTEAEWEYACRAGTKTPFSFGECLLTAQANYCGNYPLNGCKKGLYREKATAVKDFPPNAWGLTGMHGNVWEWCRDRFGQYPDGVVTDPEGPPSGLLRVIRGGGWNSYAKACRSGNRSGVEPTKYFANLGFRVVKDF